ncbi:hypothetical protein Mapa_012261 [Marchantia paleacea]|nr:hypothetical protein Mapa_012261 [Marchantia paleacea]
MRIISLKRAQTFKIRFWLRTRNEIGPRRWWRLNPEMKITPSRLRQELTTLLPNADLDQKCPMGELRSGC